MRKRLLTPRQAAARVGVHLETFRRWIREKKVSPSAVHNIGTKRFPRYRIDEAEVDRILSHGRLDVAVDGNAEQEWSEDSTSLHPDEHLRRDRCRSYSANAVKDGRLIKKPCEDCGSPDSQMHHLDYTKPLDVAWLCRPHHMRRHTGEEHQPATHRMKQRDPHQAATIAPS